MPDDEETVFVNLNDNRENFTAYNGTDIWNAIYQENCMLDGANRLDLS